MARNLTEKAEDPYDGRSLELKRQGDFIAMKENAGRDQDFPRPYCGVNGSLDGVYLPVKAQDK
jgi:hypothetical protein